MKLLETILEKIVHCFTSPKKNFRALLICLISLRRKANYTIFSRYSELDEKTYRRWFGKKLDFIEFNRMGNSEIIPLSAIVIGVMDCSLVNKSGNKTYGLGKFWDSKQGKAEKGLEISTLAVVDVNYNTAYHVSTRQTPPESKLEN